MSVDLMAREFDMKADKVLIGGNIFTLEENCPRVGAV